MSKKKKEQRTIPLERFSVELGTGLSNEQVERRVLEGATNIDKSKASRSYFQIVMKNIFTLFNSIWVAIAAILISIGYIGDCLFMIIVIANMIIGIVQECKAKSMVDKLSLITSPTINVIRNGETKEILVKDVVLDDIVCYEMGKQIATDGYLKKGSLYVNESLLTGESVSIKKREGDELFAGSFVVSGRGVATADKIGANNYISALAIKAKKLKKNTSPILKTLNSLIRIVLIMIIPFATLILIRNLTFGGIDGLEAIRRTAGALVGMIPSGMFLLTTVALAVGVVKLAVNKTLVQDLYCIEMLARCNVLCLDKTGTITDGSMVVSDFISLSDKFENAEDIIGSVVQATGDNNATANAMIKRFGPEVMILSTQDLPFSSANKYSGATLVNYGTFIIGASEFVMKDLPVDIIEKIIEFSTQGKRVLFVAHSDKEIVGDEKPDGLTPFAIIAIEDHIRAEAKDTIAWFKENNVEIKIISGDNPITVSYIAKRVGVSGAEKFINLEGMSDDAVRQAANEYTVFGRVTPEQKALLVQSMKRNGKTVGMTGDGVNDILAFKESDCSVAMASGSDAAKNIASLVLMDSNFANMPTVVAEGRRVVNNIQKSSSMYLMKTLFVFLMVLITLGRYPFTTKNLMILEFFIIGIPSFFLALQPNKSIIKGSFFITIIKYALPFALVLMANAVTMMIVKHSLGGQITLEQMNSMQVLAITFSGLVMLMILCVPFNGYRLILMGIVTVLSICSVLLFGRFLELHPLELWQQIFVALCVSLSLPLGLSLRWIVEKIDLSKYDK